MAKKLGVFILIACLLIGIVPAEAAYNKTFDVWDGSVTENWFAKTKPEYTKDTNFRDKTLYIDSAADFIAFRNAVCDGTTYPAWGGGPVYNFWQCTIKLRCDIDLNNINLQFGAGANKAFYGKFDGNGHVIKNIKINPNVADGAKTQPETAVSAASSSEFIGLFGKVIGDNDATAAHGGRIINLHLENVEITLPDDDIVYKAGALIGYGKSDVNIASCSVKNVTFKRNNAVSNNKNRSLIGGMAGFLEGTATYIRNSYVKGVDFSQLPGGMYMTNLYASGMANISGLNFLNIYSMDVKKNNAEFLLGNGAPTSGIYFFDSLIYPMGGTFTAGYNNGRAFAEVPERYVNSVKQEKVTIGTWDHDGNGDTAKVDNVVGTYKGEITGFSGGGTNADRSYAYYMISDGGFGLDYTPTASERIIIGKNAKLMSDGVEVTKIPETATEVTAQVEIVNSTREAQEVDVVIAGYKAGKLVRVVSETLTAAAASTPTNNGANSNALGATITKPSVDTGWAKVTTTESISTEGLDEIKVFCWNELSDLLPISISGSIEK